MKLTFRGQAHLFDPESLSYPEAVAFQAETRFKVGQWLSGLNDGDVTAMMAAVWFCLWRDGDKTLKFKTLLDDPDLRPLRDIGMENDEPAEDAEEEPAGLDPTGVTPDSSPSTVKAKSKQTSTEPI